MLHTKNIQYQSISLAKSAWQNTKQEILAIDPVVLERESVDFLKQYYLGMQDSFKKIGQNVQRNAINPLAGLNLGLPYQEPREAWLKADLQRTLNVGFWPLAANPITRGHLVVPARVMAALNLDFVVFRSQGKISYKSLRACEQVSAAERFTMMQEAIDPYFPFFRPTGIGLSEDDEREGSLHMYDFLKLNPQQPLNIFYMLGAENQERVRHYLRQQYCSLALHYETLHPLHKIVFTVVQRGLYGARPDLLDDVNKLNREVHQEFRTLPLLNTAVVQVPWIDIMVSSTDYRATQYPGYVPYSVHQHAVSHGYYNNPSLDPVIQQPITKDQKAWHVLQLGAVAQRIAQKVQALDDAPGGMPMIAIDGDSASTKTALAQAIARHLPQKCFIFHLDMALRNREARTALQKYITGINLPLTQAEENLELFKELKDSITPGQEWFGEESFFNMTAIADWLAQIDAFRKSNHDSFVLKVANAYDPETKTYQDQEFTITKGMHIYIEGKYANHELLQHYYDLRLRIKDETSRMRSRFVLRERLRMESNNGYKKHPKPSILQVTFHEKVLTPSFKAYDQRTVKDIDYLVDLRGEYQDWNLEDNKSS
jgi:uridine kinase